MGSVECVTCQVPVIHSIDGGVNVEVAEEASIVAGARNVTGNAADTLVRGASAGGSGFDILDIRYW
jgi:hypothetical protein